MTQQPTAWIEFIKTLKPENVSYKTFESALLECLSPLAFDFKGTLGKPHQNT